jgi:alkaline phosphatase D
VTGSISAPGLVEAFEHSFPKEHPMRTLFLGQAPGDAKPQPTVNMMLKHGVKSCLEYVKSGDINAAHTVSNPGVAPHVSFVDMGGHGYSVVRVTSDMIETEFVCIPRPLERSAGEDGGPLRYRVRTRTAVWKHGEAPKMETKVVEGEHEARFSI